MSSTLHFDLLPIREERSGYFSGDSLNSKFLRDRPMYDIQESGSRLPYIPENCEPDPTQKFAGIGVEVTSSIIGSLISHPCIVLRRQCQVNRKALRYHLSPFTLIPSIIRLQNRQGLKCLWKGAGGIFILRGCTVAFETALAESTPFPREVNTNSSLKQLFQHIILKFITYGVLTPFYCSSLVETVQSDIASEKPGVLDCLIEGVRRLFRWGTPQSTRLLPIWQLVGPTALYGVSAYILSNIVHTVFLWFISIKSHNKPQDIDFNFQESVSKKYFNNLSAIHFGSLVANIVLFPAETILNRLYLQGTRTIIDNLDSGTSVLPVITKYEGVVDCFHTIVAEEGAAGLYKGFGALILEYTLQAIILKIVRIIFQELEKLMKASSTKSTS